MKILKRELLESNIEKIAQYDFSNNKVFGSAYCVMQGEEIVYKNCFGATSVDNGSAVSEKTLFRLASMTKPITAFATLILVDRGMLSLTDLVSDYIPEFKGIHITRLDELGNLVDLGKAQNDIKIINLLNHTSGIGSDEAKLRMMTDEDRATTDNTIKFYLDKGLDFEPETRQWYSGTGAYDVLVKIIEKITKTDYQSFLKAEIFEPCGMEDTIFVPSKEQWKRLIDMHNKIDGNNAVANLKENCIFTRYPCTHFLGGAGLVSTLSDYLKFSKMLLNKGKTETYQLIKEKTFKLLNTPSVSEKIMPGSERWGLGVRVIVGEEYKYLPAHSFGWSGAYGSHFWVDPENEITAVFMKNSLFDGGAANESARNFEKAVYNSFV